MKHSTYKSLCDMIDTLKEATGMLTNANAEIYQQLLVGIDEFINTITTYIKNTDVECQNLENTLKILSQHLHQENICNCDCILLLEDIDRALKQIYDANFNIEQLKEETNFIRYIEYLQWASEQYCVLIASSDTPCGSPLFTPTVAKELCKVGIKTDLSDKFQASYVAIIDSNKNVKEKLSLTNSVTLQESLDNVCITIKSSGMRAKDSANGVSLTIEKNNVSIPKKSADTSFFVRGLLFIVYNKKEHSICDIAGFDTYIPYLPCIRKENQLIKKVEEANPGVTFIKSVSPKFNTEQFSENEKYILDNNIDYSHILRNPQIKSELRNYISEDAGIVEVLTPPASYLNVNGTRCFEDHAGQYLSTVNGKRRTVGQPVKPKRTIYILGGCGTTGIGVRDAGTYASQLQLLLNENAADQGFLVENYGFPLDGLDVLKEEITLLNTLPLKSGDIVIGLGNDSYDCDRNFIKDRRKYGEIFFDKKHLTEAGHKLMAEGLWIALQDNNFFTETLKTEQPDRKKDTYKRNLTAEQAQELDLYKKHLSDLWKNKMHGTNSVGAIVMNCNPFTNGHKYLIEQAAKRCDHLVVFVVQEDKSFFPYPDRIELVRQGTCNLSNVSVIGSGKFIISSLTFESYFNKTRLQDRTVDCTNDVTLFVNEIAPAAHIKMRFVGEEPFDTVTNQYNRTLEKILPMHGIDFIEIPRIKTGDKVISASEVRRLLEAKKWDDIKHFVPESTLQYLKKRFL